MVSGLRFVQGDIGEPCVCILAFSVQLVFRDLLYQRKNEANIRTCSGGAGHKKYPV